MFSTESTKTLQPDLAFDHLDALPVDEPLTSTDEHSTEPERPFAKGRHHEWVTGFLYGVCDVVCWIALYAVVGYLRRDAFFVSAFEFVLVDCVVLAVIIQALYIIGGYS